MERCDAGRPQEILGLHFPNVEPSCTGPALVRTGTSSHRGLGKKGPSACGWLLHIHKLDPSGKNLSQVNRYFFSKKTSIITTTTPLPPPPKKTNQKLTENPKSHFLPNSILHWVGGDVLGFFHPKVRTQGVLSSLDFLLYSKEVKMYRRDYIWAVEITYSKT